MRNLKTQEWQFSKVDNLIWKATKLLTKKKKMVLNEFGLTCSQFAILVAIHQSSIDKNDVIQLNLSEKTQIDPMTTSRVLKKLQKKNLVKRERGLVNARTVKVELTQNGEDLYSKARQKMERMGQDICHSLDEQQFTTQLLILTDQLDKQNY